MAEWLPLGKAAAEVDISPAKLTRLCKRGRVPSKKDMRDERLTLVDMDALRKLFPPRN